MRLTLSTKKEFLATGARNGGAGQTQFLQEPGWHRLAVAYIIKKKEQYWEHANIHRDMLRHIDIYRPSVDFIIKDTDIQGNRKMEEKAKERDNKLLLTLIG